MAREDAIKGPLCRKNLLIVLGLLLRIARDKQRGTNQVLNNIKDKYRSSLLQQERYKGEKGEVLAANMATQWADEVGKALSVAWDQPYLGNFQKLRPKQAEIRSTSGKPEQKRSEKTWLYLRPENNKTTIQIINQCLGYEMPGKAPSVVHISYAFDLLSKLELYRERQDRDAQGAGSRCFALDFSASETRELEDCKVFVKQQIKVWQVKYGVAQKGSSKSEKWVNEQRVSTDLENELKAKLDAWATKHREAWRSKFDNRDDVVERRIHLPLKASIALAPAHLDRLHGGPNRSN
jgi:hypothetical protein